MFILYRNTAGTADVPCEQCPIRVGKVVRLNYELEVPNAVVESWWPLLKPSKFGRRVNMFGTWLQGGRPISDGALAPSKRHAGSAWSATQCVMVNIADILVWPLAMEPGTSGYADSMRIPFSALTFLQLTYSINLALPEFTFAARGKDFFKEAMWRWHNERQPPP